MTVRLANLEYVRWRARQCTRYAKTVADPEVVKLLTDLARDLDRFAAAGEWRLARAAAAESATGVVDAAGRF